jgi:hypothetical protein
VPPTTPEDRVAVDHDDEAFQPVTDIPRLDQLNPRPCQRCGYDTANDPDHLGKR